MYPHYPTNPDSYEFLTDNGITYIVEFSNASFYFNSGNAICSRIEDVNFGPISYENKINDNRISETIVDIIKTRCRSQNGAILFICDSIDSKDKCRSRLFNTWNIRFNADEFHFQPAIIEYPERELNVGLIVEFTNPHAQEFLNEFINEAHNLEDKN